MSQQVETLLIEIEARNAEGTLGRLKSGMKKTGDAAVEMERGTDRAEKGTGRLAAAGARLDSALSRQVMLLGSMAAGFMGVHAAMNQLRTAFSTFVGYEYQMAKVAAVSGATAEEFARLTAESKKLGATTMFTAQQVAEAETVLAQAGFKTNEIIAALPALLDLSLVGMMDLATATDYSASALRAFGMDAAEASRIADVYGKAAASTNTDVQGLGEGMKYVAPLAATLGIEFEEVAAALGVLADAGIKGSMAGTSLRMAFVSMLRDTSENRDTLRRMGLTMEEVTPLSNTLGEAMEKFAKAGLSAGDAMETFSQRGGPSVLVLTENYEKLKRLTTEMENAKGKGREMAAIMEDTTTGAMKSLESAVEGAQLAFGAGMAPAVTAAMEELTKFFRAADGAERFGRDVGQAISLLADVLMVVVKNADALKAALMAIIALKVAGWAVAGVAGLAKLGAAFTALGSASLTGAAGLKALTLAAGSAQLVIGGLFAALLLVNERMKSWAESSRVEMERLVQGAADLTNRIRAMRAATGEAISTGDPTAIADRLAAVDAVVAAKTKERAEAQERLNSLLREARTIREENQIGEGDARATKNLADVQARAQAAQLALNEVNIELQTAQQSVAALTEAQAKVGLPQEVLPPPVETGEERKLREVNVELAIQAKELREVAAAYAESVEAGEAAAAAMEAEVEIRKAAATFVGMDTRALRENMKAKAAADKLVTGAAKLAALAREEQAQKRVADAAKESTSAAKLQAKQNEVLASVAEAVAGAHESQREAIAGVIERTAALIRVTEQAARVQDLEVQIEQQWRLAEAYYESTAAGAAEAESQRVENEIRQATIGLLEEEAKEVAALIRERERAARATAGEMSIAKIRDQIAGMERLAAVRRDQFATEREYVEALRLVNVEQEANRRIIEAKVDSTSEAAAEIRRLTAAESELAKKLKDNDELLMTSSQKAAAFGEALQGSIPGLDDEMSQIASGLGRVIEGLVAATEAANQFGKAQGWAMAAQGIYAIAQASGLLNQNVSSGGFGGRGEGNYSAAGSAIGSVIGGIIGAYFGSPQAGMAIGGAAGGILGSFVKKGADEALATMLGGPNGLATILGKIEGGLGQALGQLGVAINEALMSVIDLLGGAIESLPNVGMKIRDGVISMTVGAVRAKFESMDDAIGFAVSEILKQGEITGLSDTIKTVLENTLAMDMSQLTRDLEFGRWYERLGLDEAGREFLDAMAAFRMNLRKATQLGLDIEPIYAELTRNLADIRRQILGIVETDEERIRRQADSYNAQVKLFEAEQLMRQSELLLKKADIEAKLAILRAELGITEGSWEIFRAEVDIARERARLQRAGVEIDLSMLEIQGAIVSAEGQLLGSLITQLMAVDQALAAIDLILPTLTLISEEEIAAAIARAAGAAGGAGGVDTGASTLESFLATLVQLERAALPEFDQRLLELQERFADLAAQAVELGESEERVAAAREVAIRQLVDQMLDPIRSLLTPDQGGTYGMSDPQARAAEIGRTFDELWAANQRLFEEEGRLAITREELVAAHRRAMDALTNDVIGGLGLPLEDARARVKALGDAVDWLRSMESGLGADLERFNRVMDQLMRQSEATLLGMAAELLDIMGQSEEAAALRRQMEEMEFALKVAEFQFMYQQYLALGLISDEVAARLEGVLAFISDPANWPDFDAPPAGYGGGGGYTPPPTPEEPEWMRIRDEMAALAAEWNELQFSPLVREARSLRKEYEDLRAEAVRWRLSVTEFDAAWAIARQNFVDEALEPYRHIGESAEQRQLRELNERFADIRESFVAIGATAEQMAELEQARQAALADFWRQVTENARAFLEELRGGDPRINTRTRLTDLREQFNAAVLAARNGDLSAINRAVDLGRQLRDMGASFYGTASGAYGGLLDDITRAIESLPGMESGIADQQLNVSRQQLEIQRRMLVALGGSDDGLVFPGSASAGAALWGDTGRNRAADREDAEDRERESNARIAALEEEIRRERERSARLADSMDDLSAEISRLASSVVMSNENSRRSGGDRINP